MLVVHAQKLGLKNCGGFTIFCAVSTRPAPEQQPDAGLLNRSAARRDGEKSLLRRFNVAPYCCAPLKCGVSLSYHVPKAVEP